MYKKQAAITIVVLGVFLIAYSFWQARVPEDSITDHKLGESKFTLAQAMEYCAKGCGPKTMKNVKPEEEEAISFQCQLMCLMVHSTIQPDYAECMEKGLADCCAKQGAHACTGGEQMELAGACLTEKGGEAKAFYDTFFAPKMKALSEKHPEIGSSEMKCSEKT